jgi:superfamily II DNA or RNA helicase
VLRARWPVTVGFRATPERADKVALGKVWERIVYQEPLIDMIAAGYLSDLRAIRVALQADLDQVHTPAGGVNRLAISKYIGCARKESQCR